MPYKPISARIQDLFQDVPSTTLSADADSGAGTISVDSIRDLAVDKILFVGEPGAERSEIVLTHGSTAPSGSTVTLASNLVLAHDQGTKLWMLDYNQVEFSHAATVDGSKSVLSTEDIDADQEKTTYRDSSQTSGYYFYRFKNSLTSVYSDYYGPIPYAGWAENQVGKAIEYAIRRNKLPDNTFTENVDHQFCIDEVNACLLFIQGKEGLKRWHNLQEFEYDLGNVSRGLNKLALPSTMWQWSNKSVLQFSIGDGAKLTYRDEIEWQELMEGVNHTTVASTAAVGATSATVTDARDLPDAGTFMSKGISITYTAKDNATGILSGIPASGTGSITSELAAGDDVWEGEWEEGDPEYFTVKGGYLLWWPLINSALDGMNAWLDFWKEAPTVDNDADTLDQARYDMVKFWLTWAIRCQVKYDGERKVDDGDWVIFSNILRDAITLELKTQGQKYKSQPHLNRIDM